MNQDFGLLLNLFFVFFLYLFIAYIVKSSLSMLFSAPETIDITDEQDENVHNINNTTNAYLLSPTGEKIKLSNTNTIGRSNTCDIHIDDEYISHHHVTIYLTSKESYIPTYKWIIRDEGSTNGTFVNTQQLQSSEKYLADSDKISLGRHHFIFKVG